MEKTVSGQTLLSQDVTGYLSNFSISLDKSYVATIHWIPAFAGMTGVYTQSSFRRKPESSDCYPVLLRSYLSQHYIVKECVGKLSEPLIAVSVVRILTGQERGQEIIVFKVESGITRKPGVMNFLRPIANIQSSIFNRPTPFSPSSAYPIIDMVFQETRKRRTQRFL